MIYKELDPLDWDAQSSITRRSAEEQMPYYLRRFFGTSTEVDVLNQLCVRSGGVVTRADHVILHPFGMLVVDSRSVSGSFRVREDGRWTCLDPHAGPDIRSPVMVACEQALSLKSFLDRKVRQKGFFDRIELDVLVAVPDADAIEWGPKGPLPEVCNADQVARRVNACIARCRGQGTGKGLLVPEQRRRLAKFLCTKHLPQIAYEGMADD